jgi:3-methyladenine DNA glycosylase AlkD
MNSNEIISKLRSFANPHNVAGMARFGINSDHTLGVPIPALRNLAKEIGKNHELADALWRTKIHEAKILASMIEEVSLVTEDQMDEWIADFDSWDVCDQVCMNLFCKTPTAFSKAKEWTSHNREFERRAGFALMATLAVHDKKAPDQKFVAFFPLIEKYAEDDRNFVKKAVNWALRQIGKRNAVLGKKALMVAGTLKTSPLSSARWIGSDAYRELVNRDKTLSHQLSDKKTVRQNDEKTRKYLTS